MKNEKKAGSRNIREKIRKRKVVGKKNFPQNTKQSYERLSKFNGLAEPDTCLVPTNVSIGSNLFVCGRQNVPPKIIIYVIVHRT